MGPGVYAARYRHRVSARLLPRPARRIAHSWDRDGTAPLPYVSDPAEYIRQLLSAPITDDFQDYILQHLGKPDPDERLRGADADPDPDRAAGTGEQDGGEDRGGERAGDSEGPTPAMFARYARADPNGWGVYLANRHPSLFANINTTPVVPDPDPRGDVPTDIEGDEDVRSV